MDAVSVNNLQFGYDNALVVDIPEFSLARGESVAVIGPSGCGKTSFMHLLAGLLRPTSGKIAVLGQDLAALGDTALDRFRGGSMGLVFQRFHLIRALSVRQNLLLAAKLSRRAVTAETVTTMIQRLDIAAVADQKPHTLSQGQAQRAAIARALIHEPQVVLADEPTSALDDQNAEAAILLLQEAVAESGAALLVVTHDQRIRGALNHDFDLRQPS